MSTYVHGATENRKLRAEIAQLRRENKALTETHLKERRAWARQAEHRAELHDKAQKRADTLIQKAREQARDIVLQAENQAAYLREKAYDQGLALADRTYISDAARTADFHRARTSVFNNLKAAS